MASKPVIRRVQDFIYRFEEGPGKPWVRFTAGLLALVLITLAYNWLCFRNMASQEAMDCAQIGRNIAEGKGFSTLFVRPLSIRLLQTRATTRGSLSGPLEEADPARLNTMHPDISNAPLYPLLVAGLMKVLPFDFHLDLTHRFWSAVDSSGSIEVESPSNSRLFRRYQPDFLISVFNQVIFFIVAALSFFLARRLFGWSTAVASTVLLLGTEQLWRFAVSGLPTLVLLLIFTCLMWCLVQLEERLRLTEKSEAVSEAASGQKQPQAKGATKAVAVKLRSRLSALGLAALAGALVGLGALTRYPFGWLILPVLGFTCFLSRPSRLLFGLVTFLSFSIVLTPWLVRNYLLSGAPFGTATYSVLEGTFLFPGDSLQRSLEAGPALSGFTQLKVAWHKLLSNSTQLVESDLPRLGGTWVGGFFLVRLLLPVGARRNRRFGLFIAACLVILAAAQVAGRTQLSLDSPDINSENLLVLLVPVVWIYGTRLFLGLFTLMSRSLEFARPFLFAGFVILTCLPMALSLLTASRSPLVYPPYFPPFIQTATTFVKGEEMMMSDIPWAVAWYGHTQCAWLTKNKSDFLKINDQLKPVQALFLTHAKFTEPFESFDNWVRAGDQNWGDLIMSCLLQKKQGKPGPPPDFPLEYWQKGWPNYFLLTSREKPVSGEQSP